MATSVTRFGNILLVAAIILPKSPTLLGNFCKGVKIIHISSEFNFGQLLQTFGDFYLVTLVDYLVKPVVHILQVKIFMPRPHLYNTPSP